MNVQRLIPALALTILASAAPRAARAEFAGMPDKVQLMLGGTAAEFTTEAGLTVSNGIIGATVNFEDAFDLPIDQSAARLDGTWRFSGRHSFDFGYVEFNRTGGRMIEQDIEWGDYIFTATSIVTASWDSNFPYAAYRYDFVPKEPVRISGSAGISYLHLGATLGADAGVTDSNGNPLTGSFEQEASITYPVPLFGLQLDWALRRRLALQFFTRLLYVDFSGIKGSVSESTFRLMWGFSKHVGLAGGFDKTDINLREYVHDDYKARFGYTTQGLSAYFLLTF